MFGSLFGSKERRERKKKKEKNNIIDNLLSEPERPSYALLEKFPLKNFIVTKEKETDWQKTVNANNIILLLDWFNEVRVEVNKSETPNVHKLLSSRIPGSNKENFSFSIKLKLSLKNILDLLEKQEYITVYKQIEAIRLPDGQEKKIELPDIDELLSQWLTELMTVRDNIEYLKGELSNKQKEQEEHTKKKSEIKNKQTPKKQKRGLFSSSSESVPENIMLTSASTDETKRATSNLFTNISECVTMQQELRKFIAQESCLSNTIDQVIEKRVKAAANDSKKCMMK